MKMEYPLTPELVTFARETIEAMNNKRKEALVLMGQAKEAEIEQAVLRRTLETQLELFRRTEKLPDSRTPYQLNADATALVAEVDIVPAKDAPAGAIDADEVIPHGRANGAGHYAG